ncbi:MAG TPA: D-alanyl-D-alanine carboxypeptidase/D-alanyl-D-alanine-endopeptidase [Gemmatimonadaceae bacterium]|jgi:D-alanyl-D-alanine carboxypeptidase/D-alanyl-D-alanine-endopeptidase (penicillin-binding protein 4)|nr:D-alanyl-D-alanine carboxypeptidase/D-alanyl-D-alanine-endopeptidase [Gemmatimonadaceae bacterium]
MSPARSILLVPFSAALASLAALACRQPSVSAPVSAPSPAISSGSHARLRAFIDSMADGPDFSNAHLGILIVDPERGDTLYSRNAGKLFMPASNMKILTSATILAQLGPAYRYHTVFAGTGPVRDGTLQGDLVIIGRGDPSVSDHMMGDAMAPLRLIADSLAARGIRHVAGRVFPYGDAFPGEVFGYGWTYDDFEDSYSAPVDELLFNEGFSEVHLRGADQPGAMAQAAMRPARSYPRLVADVRTVAPMSGDTVRGRGRMVHSQKDSVTWVEVVNGQIAVGDTAVVEVTHHDPDQAYAAAFAEVLRDHGISIDDDSTAARPMAGPRLDTLAVLTSPPLSDILKACLKPSQNQIAEMLFRTIALERFGTGRTDSAAAAVRAQIAAWGAAPSEAVVRDGSGLSRYDYVSPRTLVRVLDAMRRAPTFSTYYDALPIAGVDGTISGRMKGTPAENNVHAKTGTVAQSRSLSGYVTTADGHMLIFSFLSNNFTVPNRTIERVQDAVATRLAAMRLR